MLLPLRRTAVKSHLPLCRLTAGDALFCLFFAPLLSLPAQLLYFSFSVIT